MIYYIYILRFQSIYNIYNDYQFPCINAHPSSAKFPCRCPGRRAPLFSPMATRPHGNRMVPMMDSTMTGNPSLPGSINGVPPLMDASKRGKSYFLMDDGMMTGATPLLWKPPFVTSLES